MKKTVLVILSGIMLIFIIPFSAFAETEGTTNVVERILPAQLYSQPHFIYLNFNILLKAIK